MNDFLPKEILSFFISVQWHCHLCSVLLLGQSTKQHSQTELMFTRLNEHPKHFNISVETLTTSCFTTGVQAFADALLVIIKVLAQNSGLDPQEAIVKLQEEYTGPQQAVGLDIKTG